MSLSSGTRLGSFDVLGPVGAGGMGEVYRARDTRLGREVAIKVLPASLSVEADRAARFQREAQLLASLNHPNIAAIYGVEDAGGSLALVMEFVPGPTLAERIATGPIPMEEALAIARQIGEALEYAHEKGIIHRDLKPANIKVTPDGKVKVLDFGLAKAVADEFVSTDPVNSPTLTMAATQAGVILGTAAYMPPEQAKGKTVDRRADIWAFGVVLFEMLTGTRGYTGDTAAETLAAVLKEEVNWNKLPADTPRFVRRLLRRCLEKDPKRRLRDIGEARLMLEEPETEETAPPPTASPAAPLPARRAWLPWAIAGLLALAASVVAWLHFREEPPVERVLRYTISAAEKTTVHSFAISPDGRYLAITGRLQGVNYLWVRRLETLATQLLPGTEGAQYPFWSPDSRHIGFFAQGKLKRIAVNGGPAQSLCDAANGRSGAWTRSGVIVFAPNPSGGIQRVPAVGGVPADVTKTKADHRFPELLPDDRHFFYLVSVDTPDKNGVWIASVDGKENRRLMADMTTVHYVPPAPGRRYGHLLFVRENTLVAQPFDADKMQPAGELFPVAEKISFGANNNFAPVTVSSNGILIYQSGRVVASNQMLWMDRSGKVTGTIGSPGFIPGVELSPDEKSLAFTRFETSGQNSNIWLRDLARGTETRLTFHASTNLAPVWSSNADRIFFGSNRSGNPALFEKSAAGTGEDQLFLNSAQPKIPEQATTDGRFLIFRQIEPKTRADVWMMPLTGDRKPVPLLNSEFAEGNAQVSPDGRWLAYNSDETGQYEIYVRPFPEASQKWKISTSGGEQPRWRKDGKELFFISADRHITAVPIKAVAGPKPVLEAGAPEALFESKTGSPSLVPTFQYAVTGDGKRFVLVSSGETAEAPLTVVVNWLPKIKPVE